MSIRSKIGNEYIVAKEAPPKNIWADRAAMVYSGRRSNDSTPCSAPSRDPSSSPLTKVKGIHDGEDQSVELSEKENSTTTEPITSMSNACAAASLTEMADAKTITTSGPELPSPEITSGAESVIPASSTTDTTPSKVPISEEKEDTNSSTQGGSASSSKETIPPITSTSSSTNLKILAESSDPEESMTSTSEPTATPAPTAFVNKVRQSNFEGNLHTVRYSPRPRSSSSSSEIQLNKVY